LDVKSLKDFALSEGFRRGSHSAGWAGQAGILLESTTAEPEAHINLVMAGNCEYTKKADNPDTNNYCGYPLALRGA